jgi:two-component sensor histidine kinase
MKRDTGLEERRLDALRAHVILGTQPEEAYDRITRLAGALLGMPIVLVSLSDKDRQWFKSRFGTELTEAPRHDSFCHFAIQGDGPLVILDARKNARYRNSVWVKGPLATRFYAGAPIRDRDGLALGTLCVLSPVPRTEFTDHDRERLALFAGMVGDLLASHRRVQELRLRSLEIDIVVRDMHTQLAKSLQLLGAVLDGQAAAVSADLIRSPLRNAASRVMALAEIHRQMRRRHRATVTDLAPYLRVVARGAWGGTRAFKAYPYVDFDLPDDLDVSNDLAARMGLATATLVVNATRADADRLYVSVEVEDTALTLVVRYDPREGVAAGYDLHGPGVALRLLQILAGRDSVTADEADPGRISVRFRRRNQDLS